MTAEERAMQLFSMKMGAVPPLALEYAKYLGYKYGGCGEVFITAYAHFAQAEEDLVSTDSLYTIDDEGRQWFIDHAAAENQGVAKINV